MKRSNAHCLLVDHVSFDSGIWWVVFSKPNQIQPGGNGGCVGNLDVCRFRCVEWVWEDTMDFHVVLVYQEEIY
jgi:hypothetical protein